MLIFNLRKISVISAIFIGLHIPPTFPYQPSQEEINLLTQIEKDSLQYFIRMSDKTTGLTRDSSQAGSPASIAATGFSLAAFAIAYSHQWIDRDYAYAYLKKTLQTLLSKAAQEKGFFYHFLDNRTAKRAWGSEVSSIDTALLVAGALLAGQYFPGTEIEHMTQKIYERIDWPWLLNEDSLLIAMGWKPETGLLPYYWDSYNELIILQMLAIGSPTHPVPPEAWDAWFRNEDIYHGKKIIYAHSGSLFTYQYSHAYIDFRLLNDRGINYFENSRNATVANREYSMEFQGQYKSYSLNSWGLTASLGPGGYRPYGAKPGEGLQDGTIAPSGAIGSILFTPQESVQAIQFFYSQFKEPLYSHFGFKDSFNLSKNWFAREYIGIDQGISVLMLENFLHDFAVWKKFMPLDAVERWIDQCGLNK